MSNGKLGSLCSFEPLEELYHLLLKWQHEEVFLFLSQLGVSYLKSIEKKVFFFHLLLSVSGGGGPNPLIGSSCPSLGSFIGMKGGGA